MYVYLYESALNYMQHYVLGSGSVCCIEANLSIDAFLGIHSSSSSGAVSNDVKQQQNICQKKNDICLKIVHLYL